MATNEESIVESSRLHEEVASHLRNLMRQRCCHGEPIFDEMVRELWDVTVELLYGPPPPKLPHSPQKSPPRSPASPTLSAFLDSAGLLEFLPALKAFGVEAVNDLCDSELLSDAVLRDNITSPSRSMDDSDISALRNAVMGLSDISALREEDAIAARLVERPVPVDLQQEASEEEEEAVLAGGDAAAAAAAASPRRPRRPRPTGRRGAPYSLEFSPVSPHWLACGFQSQDIALEFRGCGMLGLACCLHTIRSSPLTAHAILRAATTTTRPSSSSSSTSPSSSTATTFQFLKCSVPLGASSVNVALMVAEMLGVVSNPPSQHLTYHHHHHQQQQALTTSGHLGGGGGRRVGGAKSAVVPPPPPPYDARLLLLLPEQPPSSIAHSCDSLRLTEESCTTTSAPSDQKHLGDSNGCNTDSDSDSSGSDSSDLENDVEGRGKNGRLSDSSFQSCDADPKAENGEDRWASFCSVAETDRWASFCSVVGEDSAPAHGVASILLESGDDSDGILVIGGGAEQDNGGGGDDYGEDQPTALELATGPRCGLLGVHSVCLWMLAKASTESRSTSPMDFPALLSATRDDLTLLLALNQQRHGSRESSLSTTPAAATTMLSPQNNARRDQGKGVQLPPGSSSSPSRPGEVSWRSAAEAASARKGQGKQQQQQQQQHPSSSSSQRRGLFFSSSSPSSSSHVEVYHHSLFRRPPKSVSELWERARMLPCRRQGILQDLVVDGRPICITPKRKGTFSSSNRSSATGGKKQGASASPSAAALAVGRSVWAVLSCSRLRFYDPSELVSGRVSVAMAAFNTEPIAEFCLSPNAKIDLLSSSAAQQQQQQQQQQTKVQRRQQKKSSSSSASSSPQSRRCVITGGGFGERSLSFTVRSPGGGGVGGGADVDKWAVALTEHVALLHLAAFGDADDTDEGALRKGAAARGQKGTAGADSRNGLYFRVTGRLAIDSAALVTPQSP